MDTPKPQLPSAKSPMVILTIAAFILTLTIFSCAGASVIAHVIKHWSN